MVDQVTNLTPCLGGCENIQIGYASIRCKSRRTVDEPAMRVALRNNPFR